MITMVYHQGQLFRAAGLWETLRDRNPHIEKKGAVLAFTGAGGKTSMIYSLACEASAAGKHVLVLTTTHMYVPPRWGVLEPSLQAITEQLRQEKIAVAGLPDGKGKIGFMGQDIYAQACRAADLVLVEADGSRRLPFKVFGPGEPVLPDNTDLVVAVAGITALGRPVQEVCFRWDRAQCLIQAAGRTGPHTLAEAAAGAKTLFTEEGFAWLWQAGCLEPLQHMTAARVLPLLHQVDGEEQRRQAGRIFSCAQVEEGFMTTCCP